MARKRSHPLSGTPVAEGVQFEFGDVTACAVRDERRDIAVLVERQPHFFRDLFGRVPLCGAWFGCFPRWRGSSPG